MRKQTGNHFNKFDVVGLYSNIPHEYGHEAIEYWLGKFLESLLPRFSKELVFESVKFVLENTNLKFDNEYFNQIKGTAMGTIFAPTYLNLTMGFFELTFYDLCKDKFREDLGNFIFENWSRFLNDCETLLEVCKINRNYITVCYYHVTYAFQSESTLYSCLNVKELLARSRREI